MTNMRFLFSLVSTCLLLDTVHSFSEWFRKDEYGCGQALEPGTESSFTPLRTNSGIEVKDYVVVPFEKSSHPQLILHARNKDNGQKLALPSPSDATEESYTVAYIGEVLEIGLDYSEREQPTLEYILETSTGGKFVSMTKGCDDKRASWRRNLIFPIVKMEGNVGDIVEIKAAWLVLGSKDLTLLPPLKIKLYDGTKDVEL